MCEMHSSTADAGRFSAGPARRSVLVAALAAPAGWATVGAPAAVAATTVTRWVRAPYTDAFPGMSTTGVYSRLGEAVPVVGTYVNASWFRVTRGAMTGKYVQTAGLTATNPATQTFSYPAYDPFALPSVGSRLTRYVATGDFWVNTRASASFSAALRTSIGPRSKVTGTLVSTDWMRLDDGRYLSTAVLATTPVIRGFNGRLPNSRLVALPSYLNTSLVGTRFLSRVVARQFIAMDAAFFKTFRYHITVNEGYRSMYWQKYWYGQYGAPRAAYPGTSNHGLALAVDIRSGADSPFVFGSAADKWLSANGRQFGFDRPWWLDPGHGNPEFWHYNFSG